MKFDTCIAANERRYGTTMIEADTVEQAIAKARKIAGDVDLKDGGEITDHIILDMKDESGEVVAEDVDLSDEQDDEAEATGAPGDDVSALSTLDSALEYWLDDKEYLHDEHGEYTDEDMAERRSEHKNARRYLEALKRREPQRILIVVEGGQIQSVDGIPAGVVVEVRDFDTEGADENHHNIRKSEESGDLYFLSVWGE